MGVHRRPNAVVTISQQHLLEGFGDALTLRTIMADIAVQDSPQLMMMKGARCSQSEKQDRQSKKQTNEHQTKVRRSSWGSGTPPPGSYIHIFLPSILASHHTSWLGPLMASQSLETFSAWFWLWNLLRALCLHHSWSLPQYLLNPAEVLALNFLPGFS